MEEAKNYEQGNEQRYWTNWTIRSKRNPSTAKWTRIYKRNKQTCLKETSCDSSELSSAMKVKAEVSYGINWSMHWGNAQTISWYPQSSELEQAACKLSNIRAALEV